jgi:hypothetical protein
MAGAERSHEARYLLPKTLLATVIHGGSIAILAHSFRVRFRWNALGETWNDG